MQVFFHNYKLGIEVSILNPMDALQEQVIDIFDTLPEDDGSYLGVVNEKDLRVRISKYDSINWLIDIPMLSRKGTYKIYLTKRKCKLLIRKMFRGNDPLKFKGLFFERFM